MVQERLGDLAESCRLSRLWRSRNYIEDAALRPGRESAWESDTDIETRRCR
jgi:hypothetical protein